MNEPNPNDLSTCLARLTEALDRLDAQHSALDARVDRIVATVEEDASSESNQKIAQLEARNTELERANADLQRTIAELKAQAPSTSAQPTVAVHASAPATRKTLSPLMTSLLVKNGVEPTDGRIDAAALEKSLSSLSVEQRIAVKAEMARAGLIE
jgi:chromosome segregation ATPase